MITHDKQKTTCQQILNPSQFCRTKLVDYLTVNIFTQFIALAVTVSGRFLEFKLISCSFKQLLRFMTIAIMMHA